MQESIGLMDACFRWVIGYMFLTGSFIFIQACLYYFSRIPFNLPIHHWLIFIIVNILSCILILWWNKHIPGRHFNQLEIILGRQKLNITGLRIFLGETFLYVLYNLLAFLEEKKSIQLQNEQLRSENLKAQFEVLKQQTNPHFLFNALNTLRIMVRENDPHSEEFIIKLSSLYRDVLNKKDLPYTNVKEELDFTKAYIFLLKSRFQENIKVEYSLKPESESLMIPTFALQLLIENCIKHNIISTNRPLTIKIGQDHDREIWVENNLQAKNLENENSGIGLANLRTRYALLKIENGLEMIQTEHFFKVRLKLFEI